MERCYTYLAEVEEFFDEYVEAKYSSDADVFAHSYLDKNVVELSKNILEKLDKLVQSRIMGSVANCIRIASPSFSNSLNRMRDGLSKREEINQRIYKVVNLSYQEFLKNEYLLQLKKSILLETREAYLLHLRNLCQIVFDQIVEYPQRVDGDANYRHRDCFLIEESKLANIVDQLNSNITFELEPQKQRDIVFELYDDIEIYLMDIMHNFVDMIASSNK
ncbi:MULTISPECIES: hypothetical protein [unclassified Psychrobacillus]|uniref:hypothetical protein n=1 Tax=unclassified Psychrobacillus TaxID=2636677 RepID=UPI0030F8CFA9